MSKLLEYSVIYTSSATNLMSAEFQQCMKDINTNLCKVYNAKKSALIPGSGTTGMESVARQFGNNKNCLVIRNGFFSYRWSQIFETGDIPSQLNVIKADIDSEKLTVRPPPINQVCDFIHQHKPSLVCAPHVETSTGVILNDDYIKQVADAVRKVNGVFCLDGIASGTLWIDMEKLGVDIYLTAPQKGWSSPASCGVVMLGERALSRLENTVSSSFTLDLKKWINVTDAYTEGGFMYHCTVPTNSLLEFRDNIEKTINFGLDKIKNNAILLGKKFRHLLEENGYNSVADDDCKSPTVIVSHCNQNMVLKLKERGIQVAGYVPFMIGEPDNINTFRVGLFGLEKLYDIDETVEIFQKSLLKNNL